MKLSKFLAAAALIAGCSAAVATPSIRFLIDGDTFASPFVITNLSDNGEQIVSFSLTLNTGFVFDTTTSSGNQGRYEFLSSNQFATAAGSKQPTDGGDALAFQFGSSFTSSCPPISPSPCEFGWFVDIDTLSSAQEVRVLGSNLVGATVSATFSDGSSARGSLGLCPTGVCSSQGAYWEDNGTVPPPTPNPTPEPGSLALVGLALLAAGALRARKA